MKTGWPPGLLQDDSRKLFEWFAGRLGARWVLRQVLAIPDPSSAAADRKTEAA